MKYGLSDKDLDLITRVCAVPAEIEQAILFGSRAKGNYKRGSDVDLALKGDGVNKETVSLLSGILNEGLPLPYYFDVLRYDSIRDEKLKADIDRVGVVIFERLAAPNQTSTEDAANA